SSRRRHTRFSRDWSSDVCSSDLLVERQMHIASTARLCLLIATPSGAIAQDSAAISRLSSGGGAPMVWFALALLLFLLGALAYSRDRKSVVQGQREYSNDQVRVVL